MNIQQEVGQLGQENHKFIRALKIAEQKIQELLTCYYPHSRQGEQAIVGMGIVAASEAGLYMTSRLVTENNLVYVMPITCAN